MSVTATLTRRAQHVAASAFSRAPSPSRPLAEPPAGSGLKPVMGDYGAPYVGHSLAWVADTLGFCKERHARYGPISWSGGFGLRNVLVLGPEAIGEVFTNRDKAYSNHDGWDYFIGPFFDRGVMLMDAGEHHHHRRIMQQAFTRDRLVGYLNRLNPLIAERLDGWRPGADVRVYDATKRLTLDLATEVFMGERLGPEADRLNTAFVDTVHAGLALVRHDVPGGAWRRGLRGRQLLVDYLTERLPAKRATEPGEAPDLFTALCHAEDEDGQRFTDDDVVSHMIFLLMAAHDTSTITLTTMAYFLGKHPEWQQRVREESLALGTPHLDFADQDRLTAMDLVMKESLRMYAPVGMVARRTVKDTSLCGHYLPAGTQLMVSPYPTQRMEPWWQRPDEFDPERFTPERAEDKSHRYAWSPFGGGVHKCIGLYFGTAEVKAIMHQLVQRFSWTVPAGYEPPMTYGTGPLPADGLPVDLRRLP